MEVLDLRHEIIFQIPYFGSFLAGRGLIISQDETTTRVKVLTGYCAGHTTDISNRYIIN